MNESNFKVVCNCINELSNFEDSAQHVHTIQK